jgi:hypothetical protein
MQPFPGRFRSWAIRKVAMVGDKFSHRGNPIRSAMPVGIDDNESGMFEFDAGDRVGEFVPPAFNLRRVGGSDFLPIPYSWKVLNLRALYFLRSRPNTSVLAFSSFCIAVLFGTSIASCFHDASC